MTIPGRAREGSLIHDGEVPYLSGCPRHRGDCVPMARVASPGFESFMCCGETNGAPVPTDVIRLCIFSSHDNKPVDLLVNLDHRDAIDTASVLLGGLSSLAQADAAVECTGISARWCPIHGDCTSAELNERDDAADGPVWYSDHCSDRECPLHGEASKHAQVVPPFAIRREDSNG